MDLAGYRDNLSAGLESVRENAADVQLLLVGMMEERAGFETVDSLDEAMEVKLVGKRPMWPSEPTSEQVTSRPGSDGQYLYLYWRRGRGPRRNGGRPQRKTYVGARLQRVKLAREMVANVRRARELDRGVGELRASLRASAASVARAAGQLVQGLDRWGPGR